LAKSREPRSTHREVELLTALRRLGGSARNANLAEVLDVSEETIRRTAKALAKADLVRRVHGGVYLANTEAEASVFSRLGRRSGEKTRIAEAAAALVPDGSAVFLDVGSTTAFVAEALQDHKKLTVVTNSLSAAQALVERNGNKVFLAGGELRPTEGGAFGPDTVEFVKRFRFDIAILSTDGIDVTSGFLLASLDEAAVARAAIAQARRRIVVADHLKFGQHAPLILCAPQLLDVLVTDRPPGADFHGALQDWDIETVCVNATQPPHVLHAGTHA